MIPVEIADKILSHIPLKYRATSYYNWKMITPMIIPMYNLSARDIVENTTMSAILLYKALPYDAIHRYEQMFDSVIKMNKWEIYKYLHWRVNDVTIYIPSVIPRNPIGMSMIKMNVLSHDVIDINSDYLFHMRFYTITITKYNISEYHMIAFYKKIYSMQNYNTSLHFIFDENQFDLYKYLSITTSDQLHMTYLIAYANITIQKFIYSVYGQIKNVLHTYKCKYLDTYKLLHYDNVICKINLASSDISIYKCILAMFDVLRSYSCDTSTIIKLMHVNNISDKIICSEFNLNMRSVLYAINSPKFALINSYYADLDTYKFLSNANVVLDSYFELVAHAHNLPNKYAICKFLYAINVQINTNDTMSRLMVKRIIKK